MSSGPGTEYPEWDRPPLLVGCALTIIGLLCLLLGLTLAFLAFVDPDVGIHGPVSIALVAAAWGIAILTCWWCPVLAHLAMVFLGIGSISLGMAMMFTGHWVSGLVRVMLGLIVAAGYLAYFFRTDDNDHKIGPEHHDSLP